MLDLATSSLSDAAAQARVKLAWTADEENARLAAIVNTSPDAIVSFAIEDGRIMTWNPAATRLFGYAEGEAIGAAVDLMLPARDLLTSQEDGTGVFHWAMRAGPVEVETKRRRKDGSLVEVAITAAPMLAPDGQVLGVSALFRDITERKRLESQLAESEAFLRSVLDASADCIKVVEADGTLSYMNRNGLCAMEIDDFSAVKGAEWACLWPDETAGKVRGALEAAHKAERSHFEAFCPTAKGTPKWWDVSVTPVRDEQRNLRRIVSISRDITERKRAEEKTKLLLRELNHRVKNLFTIASGMVNMTARSARSTAEMAEALGGRLMALARSHDLIRPAITDEAGGLEVATLRELVTAVVAPHLAVSDDQLRLRGPDVEIGPGAATSFALMLHELATNSAKYGALSVSQGRLDICWEVGVEGLKLTWGESGGPAIDSPPERKGFGSQLARRSASGQLGGSIAYDWKPTGVQITVTAPLEGLRP